jgi:hypothetical protein
MTVVNVDEVNNGWRHISFVAVATACTHSKMAPAIIFSFNGCVLPIHTVFNTVVKPRHLYPHIKKKYPARHTEAEYKMTLPSFAGVTGERAEFTPVKSPPLPLQHQPSKRPRE